MNTPHLHLVPKNFHANLKFRRELIQAGNESKTAAQDIWIMCSQDPLFYINSFCWIYEPRKEQAAIPFITWPFQDDALTTLIDAREDVVIEKSRDMGASWMCLTAFEYEWQFRDLKSFLMLSRKEDLVDKTDDPDSLFWKIDFILKNQPGWLRPEFDRNKLMLINRDNGSTIAGDSTTQDVARGGRRSKILLDEFASVENGEQVLAATQANTNCRIFNSTPKGSANAFYAVAHQKGIKKLRLHWPLHPEKSIGLYHDPETGQPRSPWYDKECARSPHPMLIRQELDIDYLGSDYQFFDAGVIAKIENEFIRPPFLQGDIEIDNDTLEVLRFTPNEKGKLQLWFFLDGYGKPPQNMDVVLAADIATGTGSSNSVISGGNRRLGEKVLEFATPNMVPEDLAKVFVALGKWLNAFGIWEANGPGRNFGMKVLEYRFRRVYYRLQKPDGISKKYSDVPGWFSTKATKLELLGNYRAALKDNHLINRSKEAVNELKSYVFGSNGEVAHSSSTQTMDPTGASDNHGDRVIADALLFMGMKQVASTKKAEDSGPPPDSFAWRQQKAREEREATASETW